MKEGKEDLAQLEIITNSMNNTIVLEKVPFGVAAGKLLWETSLKPARALSCSL